MTPGQRAEMRAKAAKVVASWPPLTEQQRDRLAVLLAPMPAAIARASRDKAA